MDLKRSRWLRWLTREVKSTPVYFIGGVAYANPQRVVEIRHQLNDGTIAPGHPTMEIKPHPWLPYSTSERKWLWER